MLTEGGGGVQEPPILADVICEQPLNNKHHSITVSHVSQLVNMYHASQRTQLRMMAKALKGLFQPTQSHLQNVSATFVRWGSAWRDSTSYREVWPNYKFHRSHKKHYVLPHTIGTNGKHCPEQITHAFGILSYYVLQYLRQAICSSTFLKAS